MLFFMRLCVKNMFIFTHDYHSVFGVFFVFRQLLPSADCAVWSVLSDAIVLVWFIAFGAIVVCNCSQHLFIDSTYRVFSCARVKQKSVLVDGYWTLEVNDNHIYQRNFGLGNFQSKCIHKTHVDNENEEEGTHPHTFTKKNTPPKMYDTNASNVYLTRTYY